MTLYCLSTPWRHPTRRSRSDRTFARRRSIERWLSEISAWSTTPSALFANARGPEIHPGGPSKQRAGRIGFAAVKVLSHGSASCRHFSDRGRMMRRFSGSSAPIRSRAAHTPKASGLPSGPRRFAPGTNKVQQRHSTSRRVSRALFAGCPAIPSLMMLRR